MQQRPCQLILLDQSGQPLEPRIARALLRLLPRLRRQFPALNDEVVVTQILERAGHRILARERRAGPIAQLYGYAWVTLRSVATSEVRRGSVRVTRRTLQSDASRARHGSRPGQIWSSRRCRTRDPFTRVTREAVVGRASCMRMEEGRFFEFRDWPASGLLSRRRRYDVLSCEGEAARCVGPTAPRPYKVAR